MKLLIRQDFRQVSLLVNGLLFQGKMIFNKEIIMSQGQIRLLNVALANLRVAF